MGWIPSPACLTRALPPPGTPQDSVAVVRKPLLLQLLSNPPLPAPTPLSPAPTNHHTIPTFHPLPVSSLSETTQSSPPCLAQQRALRERRDTHRSTRPRQCPPLTDPLGRQPSTPKRGGLISQSYPHHGMDRSSIAAPAFPPQRPDRTPSLPDPDSWTLSNSQPFPSTFPAIPLPSLQPFHPPLPKAETSPSL